MILAISEFLYLFLPLIYSFDVSNCTICAEPVEMMDDIEEFLKRRVEVKPIPFPVEIPDHELFQIIDEWTGEVSMRPRFPFLKDIRVKVILRVADSSDGTECKNDTYYVIHTEKEFLLKTISDEYKGRVIVPVSFRYIYTGCYRVTITVKSEISDKILGISETKPIFFETKYKKYPLLNTKVGLSIEQHKNELRILSVTMNYTDAENKKYITNKTITENLKPKVIDIRIWKMDDNSKFMNCLIDNDNRVNTKETCPTCRTSNNDINDHVVACNISDFTSGNYCVRMQFLDERCTDGTLWTEEYMDATGRPCSWSTTTLVKEDDYTPYILLSTESNLKSARHIPYVLSFGLIAIVAFVFIILISYCMILSHRQTVRKPTASDKTTFSNKEEDKVNFKMTREVLLLYPRDCNLLMETMKHLVTVLRKANCRVYDCFDDCLYKEISKNPNAWIKSLIINKAVQVILVANSCSRMLERILLNNEVIVYKYQQCFDNLFIIGLNYIESLSHTTDMFKKIHVISLQEKKGDGREIGLKYLNSSRLYDLPDQLEELILALHQYYGYQYETGLKESDEAKQLKASIEDYHSYMKNNPKYTNLIFDITPRR